MPTKTKPTTHRKQRNRSVTQSPEHVVQAFAVIDRTSRFVRIGGGRVVPLLLNSSAEDCSGAIGYVVQRANGDLETTARNVGSDGGDITTALLYATVQDAHTDMHHSGQKSSAYNVVPVFGQASARPALVSRRDFLAAFTDHQRALMRLAMDLDDLKRAENSGAFAGDTCGTATDALAGLERVRAAVAGVLNVIAEEEDSSFTKGAR